MSEMFPPDILDAEVVPSDKFWLGRKSAWPVTGVVQHYTASMSERGLVNWMTSGHADNSAHLYLFRSGHIVQTVPFASRAFHAGEKMSKGYWPSGTPQPTNVNQFTIGIENCNAGWLIRKGKKFYLPKRSGGSYVAGKLYRGPQPEEAEDHEGVARWWEPYSDKLVEANIAVLKQIVDQYPAITREGIGFHSDVSPHRKRDPGPLWPHEYVLYEVFGTGDVVPVPLADAYEPDEDEDFLDVKENRGNNAEGDNPLDHYDYSNQMSMVEKVVDQDDTCE